MSLLNGSMSVRRLLALGPVPTEAKIQEEIETHQFRHMQDGSDRERAGFSDWRNPLIVPLDPNWMSASGYILLGLRTDTRKVPASSLRYHLNLKVAALKKEKDLAFIGKEALQLLKDEIEADLLKKVTPTTRLDEIAWDRKKGVIYTTAGAKQIGVISAYFAKAFGLDLKPFEPMLLASKTQTPESLEALEPLNLGWEDDAAEGDQDTRLTFLGREFLVWLWMKHLTDGGATPVEGDDSSCLFGSSIEFVAERGTVKSVSLKKGECAEAPAAFQALGRGLLPVKARMRLLQGEFTWEFGYSGLTLDASSIKLPKSSSKDDLGRVSDRLFLVEELLGYMDSRFQSFLKDRVEDGEAMQTAIQEWAKQGVLETA